MNKLSERRLKENEVIFQQANKGVAEFIKDEAGLADPVVRFYCECSNLDCRLRIPLPVDEYTKAHKDQRHFIALPGHEMPQIEEVVERNDRYVVVKKFGEVPSITDIETTLPDISS